MRIEKEFSLDDTLQIRAFQAVFDLSRSITGSPLWGFAKAITVTSDDQFKIAKAKRAGLIEEWRLTRSPWNQNNRNIKKVFRTIPTRKLSFGRSRNWSEYDYYE